MPLTKRSVLVHLWALRWANHLPWLCECALLLSCNSELCPLWSPEHIKYYKHLTQLRSRKEAAQTCLKSIALGVRVCTYLSKRLLRENDSRSGCVWQSSKDFPLLFASAAGGFLATEKHPPAFMRHENFLLSRQLHLYTCCSSIRFVVCFKERRVCSIWRLNKIKILVAVVRQICGDLCSGGLCQLYVWLFQPSFWVLPTGCQACCDLAFSVEACHCCGSHLILYQQVFT